MINKIITALSSTSPCQFKLVKQESEIFSFYQATSPCYQRLLVVVHVEKLMQPSELNQWVLANTPDELRELPAFAKNTDVVVLFRLESLADIVNYEYKVFSLEEDAYSFKKHVLYYSQEELTILDKIDTNSISDLIKDQNKFSLYKKSPLEESEYGIVSRIFIKLPFLSIPVDESELDDPCLLADTELQESGLLELTNEFESLLASVGSDYEAIVEEYIRGKMANSQAED
ncbi:ABC-three component system middle component 1 [Grimontia marina]|uniref:Uncharacterized protein n=1 Tax=Grimontia marina TaxID=646534 RepID=A0A128EYJ7_9GAMM|nr:ABC-three component system middle component 1 [Grimontia marina]CZF79652.1 hypothetical protein GMA8713_01065 [Grimontia marina]